MAGLQQLARRQRTPSLHLTAGDHTIPGPAEHLGVSQLSAPVAVESTFSALQSTPSIQDAFTVIGLTEHPLNGAA